MEWNDKNTAGQKQKFWGQFKLLPNNKIVDNSKSKAFADDKIKVLKMMIFAFDRVENIVGKGENADYQHFLLFP